MAPKSTLVEFRCRLLKRAHEGDRCDNSRLISFEEPKIDPTQDLLLSRPLFQKSTKGLATKAKEVIRPNFEVPPTSEAKSKLNILAKNFLYRKFIDKELMTLACLEQL